MLRLVILVSFREKPVSRTFVYVNNEVDWHPESTELHAIKLDIK